MVRLFYSRNVKKNLLTTRSPQINYDLRMRITTIWGVNWFSSFANTLLCLYKWKVNTLSPYLWIYPTRLHCAIQMSWRTGGCLLLKIFDLSINHHYLDSQKSCHYYQRPPCWKGTHSSLAGKVNSLSSAFYGDSSMIWYGSE